MNAKLIAAAAASTLLLGAIDARADAEGVALYHRYTLPAQLEWGQASVSLTPAAWRVGSIDGPIATEQQLRAVLGRLAAVRIGGLCAGWVEGAVAYPCGFSVTDAGIGGVRSYTMTAFGMETSESARTRRLPGTDTAAFRASGLIAPVIDEARFVGVRLPQQEGIGEAALGAQLSFRIRAVSNPLVPSVFDRTSGIVVLQGQGTPADAASAGQRFAAIAGR